MTERPTTTRDYEARLDFGPMFICCKQAGDCVDIRGSRDLTSDELTAIGLINDILRRLRRGLPLEYDYNPNDLLHGGEVVNCRWLDSGYLKVETTKPGRLYLHADSPEEALRRRGSFTTTRAVIACLPRRRNNRVLKALLIAKALEGDEQRDSVNQELSTEAIQSTTITVTGEQPCN